MANEQQAQRDLALIAEITELRKQDSTARPSLEQLRAIDRVLVEQARERLGLPALDAASKK